MRAILTLVLILAPWQPAPSEPPETEPAAVTVVDPDHLRQLETCRQGILDPAARPEDRRRWVELLFSYRTVQADALIIELLEVTVSPDIPRALCAVMADRSVVPFDRLAASFIDPLIELLGAANPELRLQAARALSDFPGPEVPLRLGELAANEGLPLPHRLAAIEALAPNTHRRDVVGQLVDLLDSDAPELVERVVSVLEPLTAQTFGRDVERWRAWWRIQIRLREEAWLAEQLRIYRERLRKVSGELRQFREDTQRNLGALTVRMGEFQRELFRLSGDHQDARLVEWLRDPLPEVKLTALAIIKARIADEGKRPEDDVLTALLTLLREGSPPTRRAVLEIVQNLSDPAVIEAVLAQLETERDVETRHALFKALGRLNRPESIPALVREIAGVDSPEICVREAAMALGSVARKAESAELLQAAVTALKERYRSIPAENAELRAALIHAMAGVADPSFAPELVEALDSDNPTILRWAIRGLRAIEDRSKLSRIRALVEHADPLVRVEAIEALGRLGREEADLERLLTRLNPANESNDRAREAAWEGFRAFFSARPLEEQVKAAERLREFPSRELRYLQELTERLSALNGRNAERERVLDRLVTVMSAQGRHGEAVSHLRALCDLLGERSDRQAVFGCGIRLLDLLLRAGDGQEAVKLIRQLALSVESNGEKEQIVEAVRSFLESPAMMQDAERTRALLTVLQSVPDNAMGVAWSGMLDRVAARVQSGDPRPPNKSAPGN